MEPATYQVPVYAGLTQFKLFHWIVDNSTLNLQGHYFATLLALKWYREDGFAYPSMETIASVLHITMRQVNRYVSDLRASGEWVVIPGDGGRRNQERSIHDDIRSNLYYPNIPADKLPEGVTLLRYDEVIVRERVPVPPRVPTAVYEADEATGTHVDTEAITDAPSDDDQAFVSSVYAERVQQEQRREQEPVPTPPVAEPQAEALGTMQVVEQWIADAMPEHVDELRYAGKAARADIERAAEDVVTGEHSLREVLDAALRHTRLDVQYAPAWLSKVALSRPGYWLGLESGRTHGVSEGEAEVHAWLNHGTGAADIDYGVTGQAF